MHNPAQNEPRPPDAAPACAAIFTTIRKRDGRIVPFDADKITRALLKAGRATGEFSDDVARALATRVIGLAQVMHNASGEFDREALVARIRHGSIDVERDLRGVVEWGAERERAGAIAAEAGLGVLEASGAAGGCERGGGQDDAETFAKEGAGKNGANIDG